MKLHADENELDQNESEVYEQTVRTLVEQLHTSFGNGTTVEVKSGRSSKMMGMSTQSHQIDVMIEDQTHVFLVECKSWRKAVSLPALLTHLGRWVDIQPMIAMNQRKKTIAIMVTTVGFQQGAIVVANYYGIQLWRVTSADDFAIRFRNRVFNSLGMRAMIGPPSADGMQSDALHSSSDDVTRG